MVGGARPGAAENGGGERGAVSSVQVGSGPSGQWMDCGRRQSADEQKYLSKVPLPAKYFHVFFLVRVSIFRNGASSPTRAAFL